MLRVCGDCGGQGGEAWGSAARWLVSPPSALSRTSRHGSPPILPLAPSSSGSCLASCWRRRVLVVGGAGWLAESVNEGKDGNVC